MRARQWQKRGGALDAMRAPKRTSYLAGHHLYFLLPHDPIRMAFAQPGSNFEIIDRALQKISFDSSRPPEYLSPPLALETRCFLMPNEASRRDQNMKTQPFKSTAAVTASALSLLLVGASSTLAATPDFYKGKTVRIVVGFSSGGGYDTYARTLARHILKHIPGKPRVIVQNMPGAASLKSILYLDAGAQKDGTVIASFNHGVILESMTNPKKVKVKLNNYHYIGSTTRDFRICYAWHKSGITSLGDVMGKRQFILGGTSKGASSYINGAILKNVIGVNVKHVLGYPGSAEQRISVERGELSGDCGSWSSIPDNWIKNKKIIPIVQFSKDRSEDMPEGIPYAVDLVKDPKKKALLEFMIASNDIGKPYILSKKVPIDRVRILRAAFDATMKDKDFLASAGKLGLPITPVGGAEVEKIVAKIYQTPPLLVQAAIKAAD